MTELHDLLARKYSKNAKFFDGNTIPKVSRVRTNICGLDLLWGGGLPVGRLIELSGSEHLGKSAISLALCKGLEEQGKSSLYIDLEHTVSNEQVQNAQLDPRLTLIAQPDYGEAAIDLALDAAEAGASLVVIDSLPMLMPKASEEKVQDDSSARDVAGIASLLDRTRLKMVKGMESTNCCLLFINQVRDKINSPYGGLNTPGGHTIKHLFSIRTQLTHATMDKGNPGTILTHMKTIKNKTHTNGLEGQLTIVKGRVDRAESLVTSAQSLGIIEKKGAWFALDGTNIGQGSKKAGEFLLKDPKLYQEIYEAVLNKAGLEAEDAIVSSKE